MRFEEACSEVDYIINHMNAEDKAKIPKSIIDFFYENKSITYKVNLLPDKELKNQDLKDETKAFLQIIYHKCFAEELEKDQFNDLLKKDMEPEEVAIVPYKENKLKEFIKKIISFFIR